MLSLCTFVKNESNCIRHMIESVRDHVHEIVVVDTGSEDDTVEIAESLGARVYQVGFTDFAHIRTLASHLARGDWVLMLDADETLSKPEMLKPLMKQTVHNAFALPRMRWLDLEMTRQTELEAYPDYQVRLYRNNLDYRWQRELPEFFHGAAVEHLPDGPVINHFHDVFKDEKQLEERGELYHRLSQIAGVHVEGGKPV